MRVKRGCTDLRPRSAEAQDPAAIVAATRQLVSEGKTPSIDDIAEAADVSRRTIYLYFPTLDQLVLDASVALLSEATVDAALDTERFGDDPVARVDALVSAFVRPRDDALPLGRKIIRLTVDAPRAVDGARRRLSAHRVDRARGRTAPTAAHRRAARASGVLARGGAGLGSDDRAARRARPRHRAGGSRDALGGTQRWSKR